MTPHVVALLRCEADGTLAILDHIPAQGGGSGEPNRFRRVVPPRHAVGFDLRPGFALAFVLGLPSRAAENRYVFPRDALEQPAARLGLRVGWRKGGGGRVDAVECTSGLVFYEYADDLRVPGLGHLLEEEQEVRFPESAAIRVAHAAERLPYGSVVVPNCNPRESIEQRRLLNGARDCLGEVEAGRGVSERA